MMAHLQICLANPRTSGLGWDNQNLKERRQEGDSQKKGHQFRKRAVRADHKPGVTRQAEA